MNVPACIPTASPVGRTERSLLRLLLAFTPVFFLITHSKAAESKATDPKPAAKVSYYREIRPILQANCQGCHQPAKTKGGYMMTEFKRLLAGGDNEGAAIVPGHPEKSAILKMVMPQDGEVRMPKGKTPLMENEVALINSWIQQGDRKSTRLNSSHGYISYAVFCLKKKKIKQANTCA